MFDRVVNMLLMLTPQCKQNIKFSKGRSERSRTKQKREMNLMNKMPDHGQEFYLLYIPENKQKQHPATL